MSVLELRIASQPLPQAIVCTVELLLKRGKGRRGASPKLCVSGCFAGRHLPSLAPRVPSRPLLTAWALHALEPGQPGLFPPVLSQFFVICPVFLKNSLA